MRQEELADKTRGRTKVALIGFGVLVLAVALMPSASAIGSVPEDPKDQCSGWYEINGCYYNGGNGVWHYCKIWTASAGCIEGG